MKCNVAPAGVPSRIAHEGVCQPRLNGKNAG
jgi:hypothetical protein